MSRFKTFDSTGVAPNGRLFAGDLNAIQDRYADLSNYAQTVDIGTLRIGEAGLQLLRYAAGESRLTGHFRTDGIVRGLGGLYAGAYTTTQRDAIPSAQRPTGLIILNTNSNRLEINLGSEATPDWQALARVDVGQITLTMLHADLQARLLQPGMTMIWPYAEGSIPTGCVAMYGQAISRAANPINNGHANAAGYPHGNGDGVTTFNILDTRGRTIFGKDNTGGTAAGRIGVGNNGQTVGGTFGAENVTLSIAQIPSHSHTVNSHSHGGLVTTVGDHAHSNAGAVGVSAFLHSQDGSGNLYKAIQHAPGAGVYTPFWGWTETWPSGSHNHGIPADAPDTNAQGSGGSHNNLPPGAIGIWIMRLG